MATTTSPRARTEQQALIRAFEREAETTSRVLRAYPEDRLDLRPHEKCKNARQLAWMFVLEQGLTLAALRDEMDLTAELPEPPATMAEIIDAFEARVRELLDEIRGIDDAELASGTVRFVTAPKTWGDVPTGEFLWFLLHDQIHHRGQFSIYLRMADGKVPSIYGPTADEPWM